MELILHVIFKKGDYNLKRFKTLEEATFYMENIQQFYDVDYLKKLQLLDFENAKELRVKEF